MMVRGHRIFNEQSENGSGVMKDSVASRIDSVEKMLKELNKKLSVLTEYVVRGKSENNPFGQKEIGIHSEYIEDEKEDNELKQWMKNEVKLPYYRLFKGHGFEDLESIRYITVNELKEMKIDKVGHRMKLLREIAKLNVMNE